MSELAEDTGISSLIIDFNKTCQGKEQCSLKIYKEGLWGATCQSKFESSRDAAESLSDL